MLFENPIEVLLKLQEKNQQQHEIAISAISTYDLGPFRGSLRLQLAFHPVRELMSLSYPFFVIDITKVTL